MSNVLSRRSLILGGLVSAATLAAPAVVRATPTGTVGPDRLWIQRPETGEVLNHPFVSRDNRVHRQAWASYSYFWRDIKDGGQAVWMDPRLLVHLSRLQVEISRQRGEEVLLYLNSGYRTVERNARIEGAAQRSLHCVGCAADFFGRNVPHRTLLTIADALPQVGGVGGYSSFTHIDTGAGTRRWGTAVAVRDRRLEAQRARG